MTAEEADEGANSEIGESRPVGHRAVEQDAPVVANERGERIEVDESAIGGGHA